MTPALDVCVLVAQLCLTVCYPMDCSPPGSSVPEILQARILEWVAIPFSRGSSQLRDESDYTPTTTTKHSLEIRFTEIHLSVQRNGF